MTFIKYRKPWAFVKCECGCGKDVKKPFQRFILGHNQKLNINFQRYFLSCFADRPMSIKEVTKITLQSYDAARVLSAKLCREGKLKRITRGIYVKR